MGDGGSARQSCLVSAIPGNCQFKFKLEFPNSGEVDYLLRLDAALAITGCIIWTPAKNSPRTCC